jgi:hypothetical protein
MSPVRGLRFVYFVALAVWIGGLIVLGGLAAPTIFTVLQAASPTGGRGLAASVFGALLARFHLVGFACGAVMAASLVAMALLGPRPRPFGPRLTIIGAMLASTAVVAGPIGWRVEAIRASVNGPIAELPERDPRRIGFDRAHALATACLAANVAGGLLLMFWDVRERRT